MTDEKTAFEILQSITRDGAYANLALKEQLSDDRAANVGRSTALIYTALENLNYCDFLIDSYAKGRVHSSIRTALRLALTEMFFMDTPDHAVCNKYTSLAAQIGKAKLRGFVNGVLRSIARDRDAGQLPKLPDDPAERLRITSGYPAFLIEDHIARFGADFTERMLSEKLTGMALRPVFPHETGELAAHLERRDVCFRESELVPGALVADSLGGSIEEDELFASGAMTVQSEGAMLACRCLDPKPGMRVFDACAAPGGKTAYLYDLMQRRGSITAWELHPHRVGLINKTLERLGITDAQVCVRDASVRDDSLKGSFDAVLLDVPCSGLGGGSKPDARYRRTEEAVSELSKLQLEILTACAGYLKPGCALVYSTCTLSRRENEGVVEKFLENSDDYSLDPLEPFLPEKLKGRGESGELTLYPNLDGTEGFFIARIIRKEKNGSRSCINE